MPLPQHQLEALHHSPSTNREPYTPPPAQIWGLYTTPPAPIEGLTPLPQPHLAAVVEVGLPVLQLEVLGEGDAVHEEGRLEQYDQRPQHERPEQVEVQQVPGAPQLPAQRKKKIRITTNY